jgi:hypothetical protein
MNRPPDQPKSQAEICQTKYQKWASAKLYPDVTRNELDALWNDFENDYCRLPNRNFEETGIDDQNARSTEFDDDRTCDPDSDYKYSSLGSQRYHGEFRDLVLKLSGALQNLSVASESGVVMGLFKFVQCALNSDDIHFLRAAHAAADFYRQDDPTYGSDIPF